MLKYKTMDMRFEKRLLKAMNPRLRKRNHKRKPKFVKPQSHVGVYLEEISEDIKRASSKPKPFNPSPYAFANDVMDATLAPLVFSSGLAIAAAQDGVRLVKRKLEKKTRKRALEKRRSYYAAERAVRRTQTEMIEQARPRPEHPCPSAAELIEAYSRRRESEEWKVRFGTLMIDLEEHVRRTYTHEGNRFSGSSGGVKDWLERECPTLAKHYSTCQRYKRKMQEDPDAESCT